MAGSFQYGMGPSEKRQAKMWHKLKQKVVNRLKIFIVAIVKVIFQKDLERYLQIY